MNLSTLEHQTDQANAVVRDAGIALAAAREAFQKAGQFYRDQTGGKEAIRLLARWKQEAVSAGVAIPDLPSSIPPLEGVKVLRDAVVRKLNGQERVEHATEVGNRHMDITVPQRFRVGQRAWKADSKTFEANRTYDSSEVAAGLLARALKYRTVFRVEPEKQTAA